MLYSMTGFGKALCDLGNLKLSIEIKSLNSKQLDLNCKIPFDLRDKEFAIRGIISSKLQRGKIDCLFVLEQDSSEGLANINQDLFESYFEKIAKIAGDKDIALSDRLMLAALKMPDVISNSKIKLNDEIWHQIENKLNDALNQCISFRKQEGESIERDLKIRVHNILQLLKEIPQFENQRMKTIKDRINENIKELVDKKNVDKNRFEQEMIYYLEKLDISEEKTRLENHCTYFTQTIDNEDNVGKKLNFISQEIGREINTLGSKANQANIQKIVVQMKDELEKIKEQVLNVL